jgi:hypothetical protein
MGAGLLLLLPLVRRASGSSLYVLVGVTWHVGWKIPTAWYRCVVVLWFAGLVCFGLQARSAEHPRAAQLQRDAFGL